MHEALAEVIGLAAKLFEVSLEDYVGMHIFAFVCLLSSFLLCSAAIVFVVKHRPKELTKYGYTVSGVEKSYTVKLDWDDTVGHMVCLVACAVAACVCFPMALRSLACALFPFAGFFPG